MPREIQEAIEKSGQAASCIAGNKTETIQALTTAIMDSSKVLVSVHNGGQAGVSFFKGVKDYFKGDVLCTGLYYLSGVCETTARIILWIPIPGKICAVTVLKGASAFYMKMRDLCAIEPNNPLC
jgi:hypothetical protein